MVTTTDRKVRIIESRKKICPPAKLNDELCFYSPRKTSKVSNIRAPLEGTIREEAEAQPRWPCRKCYSF